MISAYESLGSDNESKPEPDSSWGAVLQEIHRKMMGDSSIQHDHGDSIMALTDQQVARDDPFSDSEGNRRQSKALIALLKRKGPAEFRKPTSSRRTSIIDVDFNQKQAETEVDDFKISDDEEEGKTRKVQKKRESKTEAAACSSASVRRETDSMTN